jgi:hypothetical protein
MVALDANDPQRLAIIKWASVFVRWLDRDPAPMAEWLLDPATVLPADAREFLAALARGEVKRPRGPKARRPACVDRAIIGEVYTARERLAKQKRPRVTTPNERAMAEVAARRRMSPATVRGIVEKHSALGITFEAWKRWGRPTFVQPTQIRR